MIKKFDRSTTERKQLNSMLDLARQEKSRIENQIKMIDAALGELNNSPETYFKFKDIFKMPSIGITFNDDDIPF